MSVRTDSIVLGVSIGVIGFSFGVVASAAGLSSWKALVMSLLVFTGASQFAAVGVVAAGGSPLAAVASGLLLGVRNTAYGFYVAPLLKGPFSLRMLQSHLVIDETTGLAAAQSSPEAAREGFLTSGATLFVFWSSSSFAGAVAGGLVDPEQLGLDVAIPAAFLALLAPHLARRPGVVAALGGAAIALALTPLLPPGLPVIAALGGVALGLLGESAPE